MRLISQRIRRRYIAPTLKPCSFPREIDNNHKTKVSHATFSLGSVSPDYKQIELILAGRLPCSLSGEVVIRNLRRGNGHTPTDPRLLGVPERASRGTSSLSGFFCRGDGA